MSAKFDVDDLVSPDDVAVIDRALERIADVLDEVELSLRPLILSAAMHLNITSHLPQSSEGQAAALEVALEAGREYGWVVYQQSPPWFRKLMDEAVEWNKEDLG